MPPAKRSESTADSTAQPRRKSQQTAKDAENGPETIAVISDIHANIHALEAVFTECTLRNIRRFYCLGDIVGYGAFPSECLHAIQALKCPTVLGNHDENVARGWASENLNELAVAGIKYSIKCLNKSARDWLKALPDVWTEGDVTIVHASLIAPLDWDYIMDERDATLALIPQKTTVCFYGHTHTPNLFSQGERPPAEKIGKNKYRLNPDGRYLINPGSVGQPRGGGDARAQFLVFNPSELTVEFVRVEYNVDAAAQAILDAELPTLLAARLFKGM